MNAILLHFRLTPVHLHLTIEHTGSHPETTVGTHQHFQTDSTTGVGDICPFIHSGGIY